MTILPEFITFAHELADTAGDIIRPLFRTSVTVDTKKDASPVTIADRNAETAMRELIEKRYPDHGIWGEEFGRVNENAKYTWVIDPVDGTKSFIAGMPTFGILISLVRLGVPVLGLIDQPISKERWIATGDGITTFNGQKVAVRQCTDLKQAKLSTTSPTLFNAADKPKFDRVQDAVANTLYGYDCYAYAQLASGRIDIIVESGLKPHDFCALRPVVEGAGGIMTDWEGQPLTLASEGKVIAAGDPRLHAQALELLK